MTDSSLRRKRSGDHLLSADEEKILDTALQESDQLLVRSLHDDQRHLKRRLWLSVLLLGGAVMSLLIIAVLASWFTVANPGIAQSIEDTQRAEELSAAAWKLWGSRQYGLSTPKFEEAIKLDPQATSAWNGLGWSRFNSGESEKAIVAFEKCIAIQPKHAGALNGLGQVYLTWKDYPQAEKYLLEAAPNASASWYGLARIYLLQGEFQKAKPWVQKLLKESPDRADAKQMLEAIKAKKLDNSLRLTIEPPGKPKQSNSDTSRGWAMFQQGNMRTAERLFRRALEKDKNDLAAMNGLGFALLNQGNHKQARPLFEKYLSLEKNAAGPMNGLARCYQAEGKLDKAIQLWEKMFSKYPGPNAAATGLAFAYLEKENFEKSQKYFQILVDANPDNKQFRNGLQRAESGLAKNN